MTRKVSYSLDFVKILACAIGVRFILIDSDVRV